jgi:Domain of unknown function (DUF4164)
MSASGRGRLIRDVGPFSQRSAKPHFPHLPGRVRVDAKPANPLSFRSVGRPEATKVWRYAGSVSCEAANREVAVSDTQAVEQAVRRLSDALDALDAAMELRLEADRHRDVLAEEVHDFSMDRSRLAAELDSVQAHSRVLETNNREAARRLDEAMDVIRDIIETHQR